MGSGSSGGEPSYWLLTGSAPSGPFTVEQIHAKLAAREALWDTRACRLGDTTWLPLVQLPGLGPVKLPPSRPERLSQGEAARPANGLSTFGNLVCVYCLAVNPFLWVASNLTCIVAGPSYKADSPLAVYGFVLNLISAAVGLGVTIALAWGGERLRRRGLAGRKLFQVALALSLTFSLVFLFAQLLLFVAEMVIGGDHTAEQSSAGEVIGFFMFLVLLGSLAFEIASWVWLMRIDPAWQSKEARKSRLQVFGGGLIWSMVSGAVTTVLVVLVLAPDAGSSMAARKGQAQGESYTVWFCQALLVVGKWVGPVPIALIGLCVFGLFAFISINELSCPSSRPDSQQQKPA